MPDVSEAAARIWKILGWISVLGFLAVGVRWFFHIPSTGKGGVLLAVGATLMPLFWERVCVINRMFWVAMLFVLLAVEYRAIDKDQADAISRQQDALQKIGQGFTNLLTAQQTSFGSLINQSQTNFNSLMRNERDDFDKMLKNNLAAQRQENANFSALVSQQKDLLNKQEELYDFTSNKLLPASDPMPANRCGSGLPDDVFVFLGTHSNTMITNKFPHTVLMIGDHNVISIDRGGTGSLVIYVDMKDASGKIIARLNGDGFIVGKNYELYLLRPDKNTVIIDDGFGSHVLKARFLNPRAFSVEGTAIYGDKSFQLEMSGFTGLCSSHAGRADIAIE